jgi:hypothetical protein
MRQTAQYKKLSSTDPIPDDVVRLRIFQESDRTVAEVEWPGNELTNAGDYFYATPVEIALERAMDVQQNYKFRETIVIIDDIALWDSDWGILIPYP